MASFSHLLLLSIFLSALIISCHLQASEARIDHLLKKHKKKAPAPGPWIHTQENPADAAAAPTPSNGEIAADAAKAPTPSNSYYGEIAAEVTSDDLLKKHKKKAPAPSPTTHYVGHDKKKLAPAPRPIAYIQENSEDHSDAAVTPMHMDGVSE